MNRVHVALPVARLEDAVRFYAALLGQGPARRFSDYAQFLVGDPALNLALTAGQAAAGPSTEHYGIEVADIEGVGVALRRARAFGLVVEVEADTVCCHSRQSKFWVADPDGRRWEVFYVADRKSRVQTREERPAVTCCAARGGFAPEPPTEVDGR